MTTDPGDHATAPPVAPGGSSRSGFRPVVAAIGLLIVSLGISGLLDDTELAPHPWWIAPLGAAAAIAIMVAARNLAALRTG